MFADTLPDSIIKRLSIRARTLGAINLGQGIPSFPTAPHIIEAAKLALDDPTIGIYPNFLGEIELREAVAKKHAVSPKNVLITVGAMEATAASILGLVENGDRVGLITPDYCNHLPQILLARGVPVEIPIEEGSTWQLPVSSIEEEAKKGLKLLIITNPNNPTGALVSKDELESVVGLAQKYGFWILTDETYAFLTYDKPMVSLLEFKSDKFLVVRSFSKEYAMTGWRVGYVIGAEDVISGLAKVHDALTGCVPKISQRAAIAALTGPQTIVKDYQTTLARRRALVSEILDQMKDVMTYIVPGGAYYVFPRYGMNISSLELAERLLIEAHVAVVAGSAFGKSGEHHIRISFAVDDETLREGLGRIGRYLQKQGAS